MDDPLPTSAVALLCVVALGNLGALVWLFQRHIGGKPLVSYEPRRSVPWNSLAPAVPLFFAILSSMVLAEQIVPESVSPEPVTARDLWGYVGASVLLTSSLFAALVAAFRATPADLGLPRSWRDLRRDVMTGATAFLAILTPVYALQWVLTEALEPKGIHPLIEDLETNFSPALLLAGLATAVIAAPLYEETVFRLILQGWLEKKEDQALKFDGSPAAPTAAEAFEVTPEVAPSSVAAAERPASGVLPGLPHGWAPVLASGGLFALVHLGHGVAPVSLFPLGVALGYIYQRTHRIVPSIVCHMLFNGFTMTMLWLTLSSRELAPGH